MEPITWLIIGIIVVLILLRIFFKLAKMALIIGLIIVVAIIAWNALNSST